MSRKVMQCPICRIGGGYLIHKGTRDNPAVDVYQCSECKTKFLSVTEIEYDYESGFMHGQDKQSGINVGERLEGQKEDDKRRYEMVKELCNEKKVLDFGCGFGGFLNYIAGIADSSVGVELGRVERDYLNEKGIKCFKSLEDFGAKADVITLFHVFEHLSEPEIWLDKFSEYLNREGHLVIEVPNAEDALLSLYDNKDFADFTYWSAHLFLYTKESLAAMINRCGKYSIVSAGQVQRYGIANHLMWLAKGESGGHNKWSYLGSKELDDAYALKLEEMNMCDTLFFVLRLK